MRVGFVGLGRMGKPMAKRLIEAGHDLRVKDVLAIAESEIIELGAIGCGTLTELAAGSEVVLTMLPGPEQVEQAVLGRDGILSNQPPGSIFIDMSTSTPALARRIAEHGARTSVGVLDAPVSGGERGAVLGTLSIMVGGGIGVLERALPVLEAMGESVTRVGPSGAGQAVKAANQLLIAGNAAVLSEAIVLLESMEVDVDSALSALSVGLAGSKVMDQRGPGMARRQFDNTYGVAMYRKDLGIVTDIARLEGLTLAVASLVKGLYCSLHSPGVESFDYSAVIKAVDDANPDPFNQHENG